jgi:hypothetical protein
MYEFLITVFINFGGDHKLVQTQFLVICKLAACAEGHTNCYHLFFVVKAWEHGFPMNEFLITVVAKFCGDHRPSRRGLWSFV